MVVVKSSTRMPSRGPVAMVRFSPDWWSFVPAERPQAGRGYGGARARSMDEGSQRSIILSAWNCPGVARGRSTEDAGVEIGTGRDGVDQCVHLEAGGDDVGPFVQALMQTFVGRNVEQRHRAAADLGVDRPDLADASNGGTQSQYDLRWPVTDAGGSGRGSLMTRNSMRCRTFVAGRQGAAPRAYGGGGTAWRPCTTLTHRQPRSTSVNRQQAGHILRPVAT